MPLLYHWTRENYESDLHQGVGWHLNHRSVSLRDIDLGDSLWAFTRNRAGDYVMAAELVVRAKTRNAPGYRYGAYRVWADVARSRFFSVADQLPIEPIVRRLSLHPTATILGHAFMGPASVRPITAADHAMLSAACHALRLAPRAGLPEEEELEAAWSAGTVTHLHHLLPDSATAAWRARITRSFLRSRSLVADLQALYAGRCQVCEWTPSAVYDRDLCEAHHWHWLSRGGDDALRNLILLCPNHHRAVHSRDALLDFDQERPVLDYGDGLREPIRLDRHLAKAG